MREAGIGLRALAALTFAATACSTDTTAGPPSPGATFAVEATASGWTQLAPPDAGPVGVSASVLVPELQSIFAASMPDYGTGQLWRFDLRTNSWTQLPAANWPNGKYRTLTYDPANRRLLTYWNGLGQVYAIPEAGGSWTPVGSAGNSDEYYEGYSFLNPVTRRLTLFAGYGFGTFKNLLWEWDEAANQWTSLAQSTTRPEPRFGHGPSSVAIDVRGRRAFISQRSQGEIPPNYDDLWSLDLNTNTWNKLLPPTYGEAARIGSALVYVPTRNVLYRFGGCTTIDGPSICSTFTSDLLTVQQDKPNPRWSRVRTQGTWPGPRFTAGLFYDAPRDRLILVSGTDRTRWNDDVWAYKLP